MAAGSSQGTLALIRQDHLTNYSEHIIITGTKISFPPNQL